MKQKAAPEETNKGTERVGNVFVNYHSRGYVEPIILNLIKVGVNILNSVQPDCMDPRQGKSGLWEHVDFRVL